MRSSSIVVIVFAFLISCESNNPLTKELEPEVQSFEGITWIDLRGDWNGVIHMDSFIVQYDDILGYDSSNYTYLISEDAGERIREFNYPVSGNGFAIAIDSIPIFDAYFIPGYSSILFTDRICVEPYSYSNKYQFNLGYPGIKYFEGEDHRNDPRIIERLKIDDKLIIIN